MSVDPEPMEEGPTFSDFDHENVSVAYNSNLGDFERGVAVNWDIFDNRGGLESDEIAELVALQVTGHFQVDPGGENDDSINANFEVRGGLGFNIDPADIAEAPPTNLAGGAFPSETVNEVLQQDAIDEGGATGDAGSVVISQTDEQGLILPFAAGASASSGFQSAYLPPTVFNYRELYGRGPVVDATDDWSAVIYGIQNGNAIAHEAKLQLRPVWDISTVEGVRSRFSLPGRVD